MKSKLFFILFLATKFSLLSAQNTCPAYWDDIQKFKKRDGEQPPPTNAILFVGSSSFTKWQDVQNYFPGYTIINRGFGGSGLTDVIRYAYDIILPYKPKQIVIYCGENDLAADSTTTAADVTLRFKTLFGIIRQNLPAAEIDFISLKPSPSRKKLFPKARDANRQVKAFLSQQKMAQFINVYNAMLDETGAPRANLFIEDNLHMNATGYKLWQQIILPYLKK